MTRMLKAGLVALALCLAIPVGYIGYMRATDNFGVVRAGVVYRSWQPSAADLARFAETYGRGSVINLRGAAPGRDWYDEEKAAVAEHGLTLIDFKMSATKALSPERAQALVTLIAQAPKPVLIHCKAGADRSGLASALYLYAVGDLPADEAARALSLAHGHFPWLGSRTAAMGASFDAFVAQRHPRDIQNRDLALR
ncbi:tyrosine-protein phosphatase [Methylopila musalis]|uniref:Tyrosine-protein phosphatase n=1 Tax=Methylopila musalis TaxID=1134781 RepID=A0ABW3Z5Y5_9HYPH